MPSSATASLKCARQSSRSVSFACPEPNERFQYGGNAGALPRPALLASTSMSTATAPSAAVARKVASRAKRMPLLIICSARRKARYTKLKKILEDC